MPAKVNNRNTLLQPIMEFIRGSSLSNVINMARLENFLDDGLFFKIVYLVIDFMAKLINHRLAVKV
jgi:hypothetical protein